MLEYDVREIKHWDDVNTDYDLKSILLGNGASMVVWSGFGYKSLYESAISRATIKRPLDQQCRCHFDRLHTTNFELVLRELKGSEETLKYLPKFTNYYRAIKQIKLQYAKIQRALAQSVKAAHLPFDSLQQWQLLSIRDTLSRYSFVYTTNYDLIIYWAIMAASDRKFDDGFRGGGLPFSGDTFRDSVAQTRVLYLHGALHLYRTPVGDVVKRKADISANLLDLFGQPYLSGAKPLIVSEGRHEQKKRVIEATNYLNFAFKHLATPNLATVHDPQKPAYVTPSRPSGLVVFGQNLSLDYDQHIVEAIQNRKPEVLAISVYPKQSSSEIRMYIARMLQQFDGMKVVFFDSTTHPLGNTALAARTTGNAFRLPPVPTLAHESRQAETQIRRRFGNSPAPWAGLDD